MSGGNDQQTCHLCLNLVLVQPGMRGHARLPCGHFFHLDCIGTYYNGLRRMQCPVCHAVEHGEWQFPDGDPEPPVRQIDLSALSQIGYLDAHVWTRNAAIQDINHLTRPSVPPIFVDASNGPMARPVSETASYGPMARPIYGAVSYGPVLPNNQLVPTIVGPRAFDGPFTPGSNQFLQGQLPRRRLSINSPSPVVLAGMAARQRGSHGHGDQGHLLHRDLRGNSPSPVVLADMAARQRGSHGRNDGDYLPLLHRLSINSPSQVVHADMAVRQRCRGVTNYHTGESSSSHQAPPRRPGFPPV